jgi:hypothetical protein
MCNLLTKTTLTILTLLTLGFTTPKKETVFIGTVTTDAEHKDDLLGLYIQFRVDTLVIGTNTIKQDGTFKISAVADKDIDVYYFGFGISAAYIQTIKLSDKDSVKLSIQIPIKYRKKFGKTVCPKCIKSDQTIPIRYGLGTSIVVQHINKGDTTYTPYDNKQYYDGGCIISGFDAKWYCKRDKIKF